MLLQTLAGIVATVLLVVLLVLAWRLFKRCNVTVEHTVEVSDESSSDFEQEDLAPGEHVLFHLGGIRVTFSLTFGEPT